MITIYLNLDRAVNIHFVLFLPEDVISQYAKIDILSCTLISIGYIFVKIYLCRHLNTYMKKRMLYRVTMLGTPLCNVIARGRGPGRSPRM